MLKQRVKRVKWPTPAMASQKNLQNTKRTQTVSTAHKKPATMIGRNKRHRSRLHHGKQQGSTFLNPLTRPSKRSAAIRFPTPIPKMTLLPLLLLLLLRQARCEMSLHAFIPAAHKTAFDSFNVLILGDLSVAKAAFRGPLAVQGKADLSDFDISLSRSCNRDNRAVTVGGSLNARMGAIHGGYTVLGKRSNVHHSVKMDCTSRLERYDPLRNGDIEFPPLRGRLIRENAEMCVTNALAVEPVNETMTFKREGETFSCYDYFRVKTEDLRLVKKWVYEGDYERNVVVVVSGTRHEFREFRMLGFNPKKTLIVFCAIYGNFGMYNTRFEGSLMAPTSSFITMDTIVNGSLIMGALRGSLASLDVPYHTC